MYKTDWLSLRMAELSEQLTNEALVLGEINPTQVIYCMAGVMLSAPTKEKIKDLKAKFGYSCVRIFPEGLSAARLVEKGREHWANWFHILPDGTPAYEERYYSVGPFINGASVVKYEQGEGLNSNRQYFMYIYPNGKRMCQTQRALLSAEPFGPDGRARVSDWTNQGAYYFIDRGGQRIESKPAPRVRRKKKIQHSST